MNKKLKITINITLAILSLYMIHSLVSHEMKNYKHYNDMAVNKYTQQLDNIKRKLNQETGRATYILENPFSTIFDIRSKYIEYNDYGHMTTNEVANFIPKNIIGNYYIIKDYGSNLTLFKIYKLAMYLDDSFNRMFKVYTESSQDYGTRNNIDSFNMILYDYYLYKFPYEYFEKDRNMYQEVMESYGEETIEELKQNNDIIIKELHKNTNDDYVFSFIKSINYFENNIGFISMDFNYYALNDYGDGMFRTYMFTDSGKLITSTDEYFREADSNQEIEVFLESSTIQTSRWLMSLDDERIHFVEGKIIFINNIFDEKIKIINIIKISNFIAVIFNILAPVIITIFLANKMIISLLNSRNINQKIANTIEELKKQNEKIEIALKEDYRTNILNKFEITRIIKEEIAIFIASNTFSIAVCDIDNIKYINKNYGYNAGDIAINQITNIVKQNIRSNDEVAMWNGHQIILLFRKIDGNEAEYLCNSIKDKIEDKLLSLKNESFNITASFGVCEYEEGFTKDKLISYVETSLEKAKEDNGNKVILYKK